MKLIRMLGIGTSILVVALTCQGNASPQGKAPPKDTKTLIVQAKTSGGTSAGNVRVPTGSTTYQLTVKDEDLVSDDILLQDDWEVIPPNHADINIQFKWSCVGGEVASTDGSSGEKCAEILFCVQFNNGGAPVSLDAGCACCGVK